MSVFKKLFKQTFIYGLATVLPRMLSFLLVPLYTAVLPTGEYGEISVIFAYFVLFNVILAYGMETAFFRFFNKKENQQTVLNTSGWSLFFSSGVFLVLALLLQNQVSILIDIPLKYIKLAIWILFLDALVIIPFAWLRARERPMRYAIIKIFNVAVNLGLNVFFLLYLEDLSQNNAFFSSIYKPDFKISYVFISNLIASGLTLLLMLPFYFRLELRFNTKLWKQMLSYAYPILIAGIAFSVNEVADRIFLDYFLPEAIAKEKIGAYSACYKLAVFMTLFATAFRLGIEPFFFSHATAKNAKKNYASITKYFTIFGSVILLVIVVFIDLFKVVLIQDETYWEAMHIVPLIILANLFLGIYHNLSVWYKITDKTKIGGYISIAGAALTIILNVAFISLIGYIASAIATLSAYFLMMLLSYVLGKKYYPIPYSTKSIIGYLGLAIGFSALSFYVFRENYGIGVLFLLIFLVIIYFSEKNEIKKILQS